MLRCASITPNSFNIRLFSPTESRTRQEHELALVLRPSAFGLFEINKSAAAGGPHRASPAYATPHDTGTHTHWAYVHLRTRVGTASMIGRALKVAKSKIKTPTSEAICWALLFYLFGTPV